MEAIPLLMAAYELYYAVLHVLLMLEMEKPEERGEDAVGGGGRGGGDWEVSSRSATNRITLTAQQKYATISRS